MKRFLSVLMGLLVTLFVFGKAESALVAYWPMDEGTGTAVEDVIGNCDGNIVDPMGNQLVEWTDGVVDSGISFFNGYLGLEGLIAENMWLKYPMAQYFPDVYMTIHTGLPPTGSFVNLTNSITLSPDYTISVWVKMPNMDSWNPIVGQAVSGYWCLSVKLATIYLLGSDVDLYYTPDAVPLLEWAHVACTITSAGVGKVYVNGVEVASTISAGTSRPTLSEIGAVLGWEAFFRGSMDELKIYDTALTANEVKADYYMSLYGYPISPIEVLEELVEILEVDAEDVVSTVAKQEDSLKELQNALDACLGGEANAFYLPPGISRSQEDLSKNKNAVKVLGVIVP